MILWKAEGFPVASCITVITELWHSDLLPHMYYNIQLIEGVREVFSKL